VAWIYRDLLDVYVFDATDDAALAPQIEALGIRPVQAQTIMTDDITREALARLVVDEALAQR
jgi:hypothetical protein